MSEKKQFASLPVELCHAYSVEFSFQGSRLLCEWSPDVPDKDTPPCVHALYQQALQAFVIMRCRRIIGTVGPVTSVLR